MLLGDCYRNALGLAEEHGLASIAFPAISTGAFGYPLRLAARMAIGTVADKAGTLSVVRTVRFVLHDDAALQVHCEVLEEEEDRWKHSR